MDGPISFIFPVPPCEYHTIIVSVFSGPETSRRGIYRKAGIVNLKTSWMSKDNAIWYCDTCHEWVITNREHIGSSSAGNQNFTGAYIYILVYRASK